MLYGLEKVCASAQEVKTLLNLSELLLVKESVVKLAKVLADLLD